MEVARSADRAWGEGGEGGWKVDWAWSQRRGEAPPSRISVGAGLDGQGHEASSAVPVPHQGAWWDQGDYRPVAPRVWFLVFLLALNFVAEQLLPDWYALVPDWFWPLAIVHAIASLWVCISLIRSQSLGAKIFAWIVLALNIVGFVFGILEGMLRVFGPWL